MLGNIGPLEILVVLIIALIVFGPKRLPELGNSLGRGIREFRDTVSGEQARRGRRRGQAAAEPEHRRRAPPASQPEREVVSDKAGLRAPGCPAASGRSPTRIASPSSSTSTSCAAG